MPGVSQHSGVPTVDLAQAGRVAAELFDHGAWSREQLLAYQRERLQVLLQRAVTHSPYYRETIGELVARDRPLADFPIMNKTKLMANFDRIVTDPKLSLALLERHVNRSAAENCCSTSIAASPPADRPVNVGSSLTTATPGT